MNLVSFTSDFGLHDTYVGVVKGVMLRINPGLRIVDLTHEITRFSAAEAAYAINTAYRFFPAGTVHLVVVDPGVGTGRQPLIVHTESHNFVGPDNGVFTGIMEDKSAKCYTIMRDAVSRLGHVNPERSTTFDGRDLFGPAAALLAKGVRIDEIAGPVKKMPVLIADPAAAAPGTRNVRVIHVDRFGNLITALHRTQLKGKMKLIRIKAGDRMLEKVSENYQEVPAGELLALWGSSGYLELSVNQGDAAELLNYIPGKELVEVEIQ